MTGDHLLISTAFLAGSQTLARPSIILAKMLAGSKMLAILEVFVLHDNIKFNRSYWERESFNVPEF